MNGNKYLASRYQETDISTASPLQLVVMLYDAAVCSLEEARGHIQNRNIEGRNRAINKCTSIISELQGSLNLSEGGKIAASLNSLYDYMKMTLFRAGVEQNEELVIEVSRLMENLRSAWRQIAHSAIAADSALPTQTVAVNNMLEAPLPPPATTGYMKSFSVSA